MQINILLPRMQEKSLKCGFEKNWANDPCCPCMSIPALALRSDIALLRAQTGSLSSVTSPSSHRGSALHILKTIWPKSSSNLQTNEFLPAFQYRACTGRWPHAPTEAHTVHQPAGTASGCRPWIHQNQQPNASRCHGRNQRAVLMPEHCSLPRNLLMSNKWMDIN